MSSDAIARTLAFRQKAYDLEVKGHQLRAAENYGRAVEAASDLGADNLAVVDMRRCQANSLRNYMEVAKIDALAALDPLIVASHYRAKVVALFSAAVAALERRRVTGTLLESKCTAAEEAWFVQKLKDLKVTAAAAAERMPFVGYSTLLFVADNVLGLLASARDYAAQCSAAQFQAFAQYIVHTADLMQLPRSRVALPAESLFTERFSNAMAADLVVEYGVDARLVQLLTNAWQRLQESGVLTARGLLDRRAQAFIANERDKYTAATRSAMAAPGLRTCALAGCSAKEAHPQHFKSCAACRTVVYCCREHQVEGWPAHKKACKAAAASGGAAAGPGAAS